MTTRGRRMVFPSSYGDLAPVTAHDERDQEAAEARDDATDTYVDPVTLRRHKRPYATGRPDLDEMTARANTRPLSHAMGDVVPIRPRPVTHLPTNESGPGITGPEAA